MMRPVLGPYTLYSNNIAWIMLFIGTETETEKKRSVSKSLDLKKIPDFTLATS